MVVHQPRFNQPCVYLSIFLSVILHTSQVEANRVKFLCGMAAGMATTALPYFIVPTQSQQASKAIEKLAGFDQFDEGNCVSYGNISSITTGNSQRHKSSYSLDSLKNLFSLQNWRSRKSKIEIQHELAGDVNRLVPGKLYDQYTFKITDMQSLLKKAEQQSDFCICTEPFYLSTGYKLHLCFYPNGFQKEKEKFASFSYVLHKGENDERLVWPFNQELSVLALSQPIDNEQRLSIGKENLHPIRDFAGNQKPVDRMNDPSAYSELFPLEELKNGSYLQGNEMYLQFSFYHSDLELIDIKNDALEDRNSSQDMELD